MTHETSSTPAANECTDASTEENKLFQDSYVKGAADFIKTCATPMTIAIQGGWGTGKTSLINLIDSELQIGAPFDGDDDPYEDYYCEEIITTATIDVWKQSIANPRANLFEILLCETIRALSGAYLDTLDGISGFITAASQLVGAADPNAEEEKEDSPFAELLNALFGEEEEAPKQKAEDEYISAEDIETFKGELDEALRLSARERNKSEDSRLVIFVDGLDHIDPEAAVDLMEKVKNYLDCPRCVFVLAIDEKTVYDGIRKKLGDKVDERRRKMFFDRFVQAPLRIPTGTYKLETYIEELLKDEKGDPAMFAGIISALASEPTPQAIKRYINTMYLYESIFGDTATADDRTRAMLLAAVILELESTKGFDSVAQCAQGDDERFPEDLQSTLESLGLDDDINETKLSSLLLDDDGNAVDTAKRDAFLSWIRKLM